MEQQNADLNKRTNDDFTYQFERSNTRVSLLTSALQNPEVSPLELQRFISACYDLAKLCRHSEAKTSYLDIMLWSHRIVRHELRKSYRSYSYLRSCKLELSLLEARIEQECQGNIIPFFGQKSSDSQIHV